MDLRVRARQGQRPGAKLAQGNALGNQGRAISKSPPTAVWKPPLLGLDWKWIAFPKALPWANLFTHLQCSLPFRAKVHDTLWSRSLQLLFFNLNFTKTGGLELTIQRGKVLRFDRSPSLNRRL